MDSGGGAYGAGKATGQFDPLNFIKKPHVIVRLISLLFSIIVFGCISSQGWVENECLYGKDGNACNYGVGIGVLAFLVCIGMLVVDALFDNMSNVKSRKYAVLADLGLGGLFTFLWFVGFCYLTNKWTNASPETKDRADIRGKSAVEGAIAFSFFSIITWGITTFFAVKRYRQGVSEEFASGGQYPDPNQQQHAAPSPYGAYPGAEKVDPYQQPPFTGMDASSNPPQPQSQYSMPTDYQKPTY